MTLIRFTIFGEAASKANSRKIATIGNRPAIIKSKKALGFERDALMQIPPAARQQLEGPVRVTLRMYYASERPDLDESVVLDVMQNRYKTFGKGEHRKRELMQKGVFVNDRQVREKHVFHHIDKSNPRVEITVEPLDAQQPALFGEIS
jgi:Holliday junction resolvase RusA-like endonuclease